MKTIIKILGVVFTWRAEAPIDSVLSDMTKGRNIAFSFGYIPYDDGLLSFAFMNYISLVYRVDFSPFSYHNKKGHFSFGTFC